MASTSRAARSTARRSTPRPRHAAAPARGGRIRWDRVGRAALLIVLGVIVLLYVPPVTHYFEQRQTAGREQAELEQLQREHDELQGRIDGLSGPEAIEREARGLGMVREGEQAIVIEESPAE